MPALHNGTCLVCLSPILDDPKAMTPEGLVCEDCRLLDLGPEDDSTGAGEVEDDC